MMERTASKLLSLKDFLRRALCAKLIFSLVLVEERFSTDFVERRVAALFCSTIVGSGVPFFGHLSFRDGEPSTLPRGDAGGVFSAPGRDLGDS